MTAKCKPKLYRYARKINNNYKYKPSKTIDAGTLKSNYNLCSSTCANLCGYFCVGFFFHRYDLHADKAYRRITPASTPYVRYFAAFRARINSVRNRTNRCPGVSIKVIEIV